MSSTSKLCLFTPIVLMLMNGAVLCLSPSRCQRITVPICKGLGYNITLMPNFVGHENQRDAAEGLQDYSQLLEDECSPFLRLFVCSVFVPLCSEHVPGAVPACRGLCEEVKEKCLPTLMKLGLAWPPQLNCSRFPNPPALCMQQPSEEDIQGSPGSNDVLTQEHIQNFKSLGSNCPRNTVASGEKCLKLCNSDPRHSTREQYLFEIWTAATAVICILMTSFALLTFIIEPKRFRWPARPILFLSVCGFVTALIYLLRWFSGPFTCLGDASLSKPYDSWLCFSVTLMMIFCDFAFSLWWCVFSLVWYLSAAKEWSTEAIERTSSRLHITIWTASVVPIIYVLVSNNIVVNEFSGFCEYTSYFLIVCQMSFVLVGAVLAVLTSVALKNVRKALIYAGRSPYKLERLIYRLGVISLGICLPLFVCLMCYFFDTKTVTFLKACLRLSSAVFAAFWVFSSKTFKSWIKLFPPSFAHKGLQNVPVTKVQVVKMKHFSTCNDKCPEHYY